MDPKQVKRILTEQAIEQFRKVEAKKIQLEIAEYRLLKMCDGRLDIDVYQAETDKIIAQSEAKRVGYAHRGLLPKELAAEGG